MSCPHSPDPAGSGGRRGGSLQALEPLLHAAVARAEARGGAAALVNALNELGLWCKPDPER